MATHASIVLGVQTDGAEQKTRLDELAKAMAEANAPLRYKGPGFLKFAVVLLLQMLHSVLR